MGAPGSDMEAADQPEAESLLTAFKTIGSAERRKHAGVLEYWLSIRGDKEFPPLHDLDPLKISDAAPCSMLLELISGGHDAEIRHIGEALRPLGEAERIIDAPRPSLLASIAGKLPIVAISRDFLAFEDEFSTPEGTTRCWVTLLPLSAGGAWVDYVYALATIETAPAKPAKAPKAAEEADIEAEAVPIETEAPADAVAAEVAEPERPPEVAEEPVEPEANEPAPAEVAADANEAPQPEPIRATDAKLRPGFSKLLAGLGGFYAQSVKFEPVMPGAPSVAPPAAEPVAQEPIVEEPLADEQPADEDVAEEPIADEQPADEEAAEGPVAEEQPVDQQPAAEDMAEEPAQAADPIESPTPASEGTLQSKLADVRTKADEARQAKLRANSALYEGLGAAYDFALDAEDAPEEYLRLVEAQGLKIQLRSPMKPVVKLAFAGLCDDSTIGQLEAVLAWALEQELPRGSLAGQIEAAGGIARILSGEAQAA